MNKYIYNKQYPDIDEIVIAKVTKISEYGITVTLTEYNNIEGFMNCTEVSRKKKVNLNKLLIIGKEILLNVIRIDKEQNLIDLSKRTISSDDEKMFNDKHTIYVKLYRFFVNIFMKFKNINDHVAIDDIELCNFMKNTLWTIQDEFDNDFINETIFNKLTNNDIIEKFNFNSIGITHNELIKIINDYIDKKINRIKPELFDSIKLTTLNINGVEDIKWVLNFKNYSFFSELNKDYDIDICYTSSSIYTINVKQKNFTVIDNCSISDALNLIKNEIKLRCVEKIIKNNIFLLNKN
jgi:translation initiation factor 2 alpha subunit (eIF-2alpha)